MSTRTDVTRHITQEAVKRRKGASGHDIRLTGARVLKPTVEDHSSKPKLSADGSQEGGLARIRLDHDQLVPKADVLAQDRHRDRRDASSRS